MSENKLTEPKTPTTEKAQTAGEKTVFEKRQSESNREFLVRAISAAGSKLEFEHPDHVLDLTAHTMSVFKIQKRTGRELIDLAEQHAKIVKEQYSKMPARFKG